MTDPHAEKKRLYALDEAAVGPEQAYSRWQVRGPSIPHWRNKESSAPFWDPKNDYRRDPEAPPLPSLDWHSAPKDAMWRTVDKDGRIDFWDNMPIPDLRSEAWDESEKHDAFSIKYTFGQPPNDWQESLEKRPNPEWFELTRPDYEASKEDDMDEYLTGAELMYAIGDAMAAGEGPDTFMMHDTTCWREANTWKQLVTESECGGYVYRKPRMRHLTTQDGQRWEWPEPMKSEPNCGKNYFCPNPSGEFGFTRHMWEGISRDHIRMKCGLCHDNQEAAEQHVSALIAASGGSCD